MEREVHLDENLPFDLSKVHEKLKNIKTLADLTGPGGAMQELMKQAVERILKAEQEDHLGYEPYQKPDKAQKNSRNGYSKKTLKTSSGPMELSIPRVRAVSFESKLIEKYGHSRLCSFTIKITTCHWCCGLPPSVAARARKLMAFLIKSN